MNRLATALALVLLVSAALPASANLVNGNFTPGLDGWTASGGALGLDGLAAMFDGPDGGSTLHQIAAYAPGRYEFSFDYWNVLSGEAVTGAVHDSFFASLYFVNDPADFDLAGSMASRAALQLDYLGPILNNGQTGPSQLGSDWMHFSMQFDNSHQFIVPYFELINLNLLGGDSLMFLTNVEIEAVPSVIPEPSSVVLIVMGLLMLWATAVQLQLRDARFSLHR